MTVLHDVLRYVVSHPHRHTVGMTVAASTKHPPKGGAHSGNRARFVAPAVPVEQATLEGLKEQMRSASRAEAQAVAWRSRAAAEYSRRVGERTAEKVLRDQSGNSTRGSRTEVEVANRLKDLPGTRKAFEDGEITYGHARIIARMSERSEMDERELVDRAKKEPVDVFAHTARKHEHERSGDDGVSRLEQQKQDRRAHIKTDLDDGMTVVWAKFDPVTGARIRSILSAKTGELWRQEDRDHRPSTSQRMADALAELICQPPGNKKKGRSSRRRTTLFLIAHYDKETRQIRDATLANGTPVPVAVFSDLACDGKLVPAIFDGRGQPLWVGRARRLATWTQRMALIARDRGCVGCGADPDWCQAHHITPWQEDGPTDIENMVLLCSRCHQQIHTEGWQIKQTPTGKHLMEPPRRRRPQHRRRSRRQGKPPPNR